MAEEKIAKAGMTTDQVIALLGEPSSKVSGEDLAKATGAELDEEGAGVVFWVYKHARGEYRLIIKDGVVLKVRGNPIPVAGKEDKKKWYEFWK